MQPKRYVISFTAGDQQIIDAFGYELKGDKLVFYKTADRPNDGIGDDAFVFTAFVRSVDVRDVPTVQAKSGGQGNFSTAVQDALRLSREEAARLGSAVIGSEHLLLALLRDTEGNAMRVLRSLNVTVSDLRKSLEGKARKGLAAAQSKNGTPLEKDAERTLKDTYREAVSLKSDYIDTEHVLLSLLKDETSVAAQVLTSFGATYDKARQVIESSLR